MWTRASATASVFVFLALMYTFSWMANRLGAPRKPESTRISKADAVYLGTDGVVFQDGSNTCGPAALKMILDHHRINVPLIELERIGGRGARGMTMLALGRLAGLFGIQARGWRLGIENLSRVCLPAIIFVENTHFVVVDSVCDQLDFFIRDPAKGKMRIGKTKLSDIWKGETLLFCGDSLVSQ